MSLFQRSVQKEAIRKLNGNKLAQAYQTFKQQFGDSDFQQNVRAAKEEQYQEGFLNDLFVKVLGYTLHPQPSFNLITEQKNLKNAKKADGAILRDAKPIAVIELKSMRTVDLQTIEAQAFAYKNNQPTARYIITSNFQKLRFYMDNAVDFEEFDLFTLDETDFGLLYACLHKEQLLADAPAKMKADSLQKQAQITQDLYLDYSKFKDELYLDLRRWNRQHNALTLFKKSQKLLDRFLFFCFAEDKGLLKSNTLSDIIKQWNALKDYDEYKPLYAIFKKYFNYLNNGYDTPHLTIFAYNGGLFAPDELLDGLIIPDNLLQNHILTLSKYDFDSEVDTNILGHIFEHSLNELDEKTAQAIGQTADKAKTKRKKDGIFYTPHYITQYIVEQTIGALCQQKQTELAIDRLDWWEDCPSAIAIMRLHTYRGWLLQLTVLDPACGSGAFLNQAFVFLRAEHRRIDAMLATLTGKSVENSDWATHILDHNLFGVDINEESVEIAKLSLWLRTAKVGRKLNDLSANIQVGNSLIDDPEVAGDLAFDWQKAFPQVFEKGGFDVVIGNPPYVNAKGQNFTNAHKDFFYKNYQTAVYQVDTYILFIEKFKSLLKSNGIGSYIVPNAWLNNLLLTNVRKYILDNFQLDNIVNAPSGVFSDATVDTIVFTIRNQVINDCLINIYNIDNQKIMYIQSINQSRFSQNNNYTIDFLTNSSNKSLIDKIETQTVSLDSIADMSSGIKEYEVGKGNPPQTQKDKDNNVFNATTQKNSNFLPHILGADIQHYILNWQGNYLSYGEWLGAPRKKKYFEGERLIIREIPSKTGLIVAYTNQPFTVKNSAHIVLLNDDLYPIKAVLAILNSKMLGYYFKFKFSEFDSIFPKAKIGQCKLLPIKQLVENNKVIFKQLSLFAKDLIQLNTQLRAAQTDFLNLLTDNFTSLKLNRAIESWHESDFAAFKKTLEKQKIEIPLKKQKEWREVFDSEKVSYQTLQQQIATTDKAIDAAVYALYELTPEEIQLIENQ